MNNKLDVEKIYNHWITTSDKDFGTMLNLYNSKDYHWALFIGHIVVPERKWPFLPISTSIQNFNPRNTQCMPVVKILIFLDLDKKFSFSFGHYCN